jgi:hypothetical protein
MGVNQSTTSPQLPRPVTDQHFGRRPSLPRKRALVGDLGDLLDTLNALVSKTVFFNDTAISSELPSFATEIHDTGRLSTKSCLAVLTALGTALDAFWQADEGEWPSELAHHTANDTRLRRSLQSKLAGFFAEFQVKIGSFKAVLRGAVAGATPSQARAALWFSATATDSIIFARSFQPLVEVSQFLQQRCHDHSIAAELAGLLRKYLIFTQGFRIFCQCARHHCAEHTLRDDVVTDALQRLREAEIRLLFDMTKPASPLLGCCMSPDCSARGVFDALVSSLPVQLQLELFPNPDNNDRPSLPAQ